MILYYSGTGNSRYCAKMLADRLGDECRDAFAWIREDRAAALRSERAWIFVTPTYGWRIPRVFARFIRRGEFKGSREAYFVMSCGDNVGNAAKYNEALCREKGFAYKGTAVAVMPENYIAMFNAPGQEEAEKIIAAARPKLEEAAARIKEGKALEKAKETLGGAVLSGPVNRAFYGLLVKAKKFTVSDACIGCGLCERACPTNSIRMENGRPVWGQGCTHCMACICGCPNAAIEYGKASLGKPRYQCPEYDGRRE